MRTSFLTSFASSASEKAILPLQIARSRSGKSHVVVDLSLPSGFSVNDHIPKDSYLDEPLALQLPDTDALVSIILQKVPGCLLFKKDLSHVYLHKCLLRVFKVSVDRLIRSLVTVK